jgi:putative flavoprotein involved in K+ transport
VNGSEHADKSSAEEKNVSSERLDVVVIGAGQAGLAIGYFLTREGRKFVILDGADSIGAAWRNRWDSLVLFTPRRYDSLPGLVFPGEPDGYPTRDEVIAYLERYATTFELPIELGSAVRSLTRRDGRFLVELDDRQIEANQVVVASGPFQEPRMPALARELASDVFQTHSVGYRKPSDVPSGRVLVVGGGNTGFQIAKELSGTHDVHLAVGSRQTPLPQRLLGRDLFWWLTKLGLLRKTVDSRLGRRARRRDTLIGSRPRQLERRYGVEMKPRAVAASGRTISFADGGELDVDSVIWATGYRSDHSWIRLPVFDADGSPRHRRGVTEIPGLYFLGLSWQHTRGSALLGWVGEDAEFIHGKMGAADSVATKEEFDGAGTQTATGAMEGVSR